MVYGSGFGGGGVCYLLVLCISFWSRAKGVGSFGLRFWTLTWGVWRMSAEFYDWLGLLRGNVVIFSKSTPRSIEVNKKSNPLSFCGTDKSLVNDSYSGERAGENSYLKIVYLQVGWLIKIRFQLCTSMCIDVDVSSSVLSLLFWEKGVHQSQVGKMTSSILIKKEECSYLFYRWKWVVQMLGHEKREEKVVHFMWNLYSFTVQMRIKHVW